MTSKPSLSQSKLWDQLRDFYEKEGKAAWTTDRVPFFATNNPALARTYVDLFIAYLEDHLRAANCGDDAEAIVLEMGGGLGRLAYLMLNRLEEVRARLPMKVRYILTDYSQSNVDFYQNHEKLKPFVDADLLQIQKLDAETGEGLEIASNSPVFAIANYLFDTLRQDGFRVHQGELFQAVYEGETREKFRFSYTPVEENFYSDERYQHVLDDYSKTLGNTHFMFPIGPLQCLQWLHQKTKGNFALVMADKALRQKTDLLDFAELPIQRHETGFSLAVNCHAIDRVFDTDSRAVIHTRTRQSHLQIGLYVDGLKGEQLIRTQHVFEDKLEGFGPLDYLEFRNQWSRLQKEQSLSLCLKMLRLSSWDPEFFYEMSNRIGETSLRASQTKQEEVYDAMRFCWANFYPISDGRDVPFAVARVLACINQFDQAIGFYGESLRLYRERAATHHNIALCHFNLQRLDEARGATERALALEPEFAAAKSLLLRIEGERKKKAELSL